RDGTSEQQRADGLRPPPFRRDAGRRDRKNTGHSGQCRKTHDLPRGAQIARGAGADCEVDTMQQLTQHLTEDQLVSHYYRDGDAPFAPEHLAACDECRAQFDALCGVLTLVDQLPIPERGDGYGDEVWTRLRWQLGSNRRRSVYGWMSIAGSLAGSLLGGMLGH